MKILLPICAALVGLSLVSADQKFRPMDDNEGGDNSKDDHANHMNMKDKDGKGPKKPRIKTMVDFGNTGAAMDITLGNSSVNQTVKLVLARLEERDSDNKMVQKSENFHKVTANWTPITSCVLNDVSTMMTSLVTPLKVGPNGESGSVPFNLTANVFQGTGTIMNGDQSIPVQAGALKFSITLGKWPFVNISNHLVFSVKLVARGKGDRGMKSPKKDKSKDVPRMDRLDLGEGMFMDAPCLAIADGNKPVNVSSVIDGTDVVEFIWTMPYFSESLYYDPVVGSTDPVAVVATDNTTTNSTGTTSGAATTWFRSSALVTVVAAAGMAVASSFL